MIEDESEMQYPSEPQRFLDGLEEKLRALPAHCQLAFGASICERHFQDYIDFSRDEEWGDGDSLREALNLAWTVAVEESALPMTGLDGLLAKCMSAIPDTEDFQTASVSDALDVGIMVVLSLEFMRNCDPREIVQVAAQARDLIDAKVRGIEDAIGYGPDSESKIASHPWMVSEIRALKSSLATLENIHGAEGLTDFQRGAVQNPPELN